MWPCHGNPMPNVDPDQIKQGPEEVPTRPHTAFTPDMAPSLPDCGHKPVNRKEYPLYSGLLKYFPDALMEVANCSYKGNEQHNPGTALHWDRSKSGREGCPYEAPDRSRNRG